MVSKFNAYLNGLQNKVAHACDENGTPQQIKEDFKVMKDSYNSPNFADIFVTNHFPELLVNLYNIYRDNSNDYAAIFYLSRDEAKH